jgi:hypothetical protein
MSVCINAIFFFFNNFLLEYEYVKLLAEYTVPQNALV